MFVVTLNTNNSFQALKLSIIKTFIIIYGTNLISYMNIKLLLLSLSIQSTLLVNFLITPHWHQLISDHTELIIPKNLSSFITTIHDPTIMTNFPLLRALPHTSANHSLKQTPYLYNHFTTTQIGQGKSKLLYNQCVITLNSISYIYRCIPLY